MTKRNTFAAKLVMDNTSDTHAHHSPPYTQMSDVGASIVRIVAYEDGEEHNKKTNILLGRLVLVYMFVFVPFFPQVAHSGCRNRVAVTQRRLHKQTSVYYLSRKVHSRQTCPYAGQAHGRLNQVNRITHCVTYG